MTERKNKDKRKKNHNIELWESIRRNGGDILQSGNFQKTRNDIQHGTVSVHRHCLSVAEQSLKIKRMLEKVGIQSQERELVRGALLHDYFLYDWHKHKSKGLTQLHGFRHPAVALKNAKKEYKLTPREQDIIRKHMWPLTVIPPQCREAWIVTAADKYCSLLETLRIRKGKRS